jgi:hypothetical protein
VSGSFFQRNVNNLSDPAHQITIAGTAVGSGAVDLVCTFGVSGGTTSGAVLVLGVPVQPDGSFSFSGPVPDPDQPCVVRALASGRPDFIPSDLQDFTGPRVGLGSFATSQVTGGPNAGQLWNFFDNDAQFSGDADYQSLGSGGITDASPVDPATLLEGADLFISDDYLSDAGSDRSDIEVDGMPAYTASTAENLLHFTGSNFAGLPALTFTQTQNPTTGDLTVHESEMLVRCAPTPATYPAAASSCTSFTSTGVRFDRTIVQNQSGRQAEVTDTFTSVDANEHTVDLRYGNDFTNSGAGFNFPWVDGSTYKTHIAGDTEPAPPSGVTSMFVNFDNALADGAENSAQGAITFAAAPSAVRFLSTGRFGSTHLDVAFTRTVAAGGSVSLKTTYSWAFTIADAHALAAIAEQEDMAPGVMTGSASSVTTTSATVAGSINPNGSATTYQFQYGTSTGYGQATPAASAGSGTTPSSVSAALTGLKPGTTYHYRLVATSTLGTTDGTDATFTTASPPPPPPPTPTRLKVGKVKIKGNTASILLSCSGATNAVCRGTLTETIRIKRHRKRVTEKVASGKFSIKAGAKKTARLTLNSKGRKALGGFGKHKLRVTLTVRLAGRKVTTRTLTFRHRRKEVVTIRLHHGGRSAG